MAVDSAIAGISVAADADRDSAMARDLEEDEAVVALDGEETDSRPPVLYRRLKFGLSTIPEPPFDKW